MTGDLIEVYDRLAGHADELREALDGGEHPLDPRRPVSGPDPSW